MVARTLEKSARIELREIRRIDSVCFDNRSHITNSILRIDLLTIRAVRAVSNASPVRLFGHDNETLYHA